MSILGNKKSIAQKLQEAMKNNDDIGVQSALEEYMQDFRAGTRTSGMNAEERRYFEDLGATFKAKQQVSPANIALPVKTYEDVLENLKVSSEIVNGVRWLTAGYTTRVTVNNSGAHHSAWGDVGSAITDELTQDFKVMDFTQAKLSSYGLISQDFIDMGADFLRASIINTLQESMLLGLEAAIVNGSGKDNTPIGLTRDLTDEVRSGGEYKLKEKIVVKDFSPKTYGALVDKIAKDDNGRDKNLKEVQLIVNRHTYLTKILPATAVISAVAGTGYKLDVFPFPTKVMISNELGDDEAILCNLNEYILSLGKSVEIQSSTEYKFLDDVITYKARAFATGAPASNTASIFLDISGVDELIPRVKVDGVIATKEQA